MADIFLWLFGAGLMGAAIYGAMIPAGISGVRSLFKTAPLVLFSLAAWQASAPAFLTAALVFSALGDLALSRAGRASFLFGLSSFALAHILYCLAFLGQSGLPLWDAFTAHPLGAVALLALALSTEMWLAPHTSTLRWPVRAYVAIISLMMLSVLTLPATFAIATLGAALFVLSDMILSLRLFRMVDSSVRAVWASRAVWFFYIFGQSLILWGLIAT